MKRSALAIAAFLLASLGLAPPASAQDGTADPAQVSTALVIDSSGSMRSNDPQNRRLDAGRAYLVASLTTDEVGVVDFDSSVTITSEAVQVGANRPALEAAIDQIDSSGGTNLGAGLQAGCDVLARATGDRRAAIFFTDGSGSYSNQVQCYVDNGWQVHTIGLGSGTNGPLLEQIASASGGSYRQLDSASNLVCIFQQIRAQIAGLVPGSCAPTGMILDGQTVDFTQEVTNGLQQATFTTTWQGTGDVMMRVTSPSGAVYDRTSVSPDVIALHGQTYDTISIVNPEPGTWKVELTGSGIPDGGETFTFSVLELGDSMPLAPIEHVCISTDGAITEQSGNADCDSGPGGSAVARGDGASAFALGTNSHATAIGVGSYASTADGDRNRATARDGGRAEASGGDRNLATAATGTAIAGGGDRNVASASFDGYAESDADSSRATAIGGTAIVMGGDGNNATANGTTSSARVEGARLSTATAINGGAAFVEGGESNLATARDEGSAAQVRNSIRSRATAASGSYVSTFDGDRALASASRTSIAAATGASSRATAANDSEAYACGGGRTTSVRGEVLIGDGCVVAPPFGT